MMGFIAAALPWVMMGVALAIYLTNTGARKAGDKKRDSGRVSFAMGMGLLAGFLVSFVGCLCLLRKKIRWCVTLKHGLLMIYMV